MAEKETRNPLIIPIFIPNQGCPHRCIFCQQEKITNKFSDASDSEKNSILDTIETAIESANFKNSINRQIAFYGGTFTNLSISRIRTLLGLVEPYLKRQNFNSIRISTRPDSIDIEKLNFIDRIEKRHLECAVVELEDAVKKYNRQFKRMIQIEKEIKVRETQYNYVLNLPNGQVS